MFAGWIFDMDGTLTLPQHNFDELRSRLGLARGQDILAGIEAAPNDRRTELQAEVRAWEREHAERAEVCPGARALLQSLGDVRCGILTRNTRENALLVLDASGLSAHFAPEDVLGRDCATPKPDPAGILLLLERWQLEPERAVMVGDWIHDVDAGRAAGTSTIWVDRRGTGRFTDRADHVVPALSAETAGLSR